MPCSRALQALMVRVSNQQPFGYKADSLTTTGRPPLPTPMYHRVPTVTKNLEKFRFQAHSNLPVLYCMHHFIWPSLPILLKSTLVYTYTLLHSLPAGYTALSHLNRPPAITQLPSFISIVGNLGRYLQLLHVPCVFVCVYPMGALDKV